jgi:hypothetical protein
MSDFGCEAHQTEHRKLAGKVSFHSDCATRQRFQATGPKMTITLIGPRILTLWETIQFEVVARHQKNSVTNMDEIAETTRTTCLIEIATARTLLLVESCP